MNFIKGSVFFLTLVVLTSICSCSSCSRKEAPQGPPATAFEQGMTAKDTAEVKAIVDKFFTYAKEKNFSEAAGMLYRNDADEQHQPEQLNNEEMAEVICMLKSVPMEDYRIEYIKFKEDYANEVLCQVIIKKAEGDMPEMATKMFFKPINYMGNWLLCLTNTAYGDKGIVNPNKRDSVEKDFQRKEKSEEKKTEK